MSFFGTLADQSEIRPDCRLVNTHVASYGLHILSDWAKVRLEKLLEERDLECRRLIYLTQISSPTDHSLDTTWRFGNPANKS